MQRARHLAVLGAIAFLLGFGALGLPGQREALASKMQRLQPVNDARSPLFRGRSSDPATADAYLEGVLAAPSTPRIIRLETTLSWGCPCPTWVFPFHQDLRRLRYVMVMLAPGLALDPTDLALPDMTVRMQGHFTGAQLSGLEWIAQRGSPTSAFPRSAAEAARREYWSEPGLVFVVERWCFEDNGRMGDMRRLLRRGARQCPK